jgi:hypothetical protein
MQQGIPVPHEYKVKHFSFRIADDGSVEPKQVHEWVNSHTAVGWQVTQFTHWLHDDRFLMFLVVLLRLKDSKIVTAQPGIPTEYKPR